MDLKIFNLLLKIIIMLLLLTVGTVIFAAPVWNGSVSVAKYGHLPQTGMYAASNAFPLNSKIIVTNPDTGKFVDVIVIDRLENKKMFLVISVDAAESLGIGYEDIFQGVISEQVAEKVIVADDFSYNPDPDINPDIFLDEHTALALIENYIDTELGGIDESLIFPDVEVELDIAETFPKSVEIVDEDIVTEVENISDRAVDTDESNFIFSTPDSLEVPEPVENDINSLSGMSISDPYKLESTVDINGVLPILPTKEEDKPVITSMSRETIEKDRTDLTVFELPVIEENLERQVEKDRPVITSMSRKLIETNGTDLAIPELPIIERDQELPLKGDIPVITSMSSETVEEDKIDLAIPELPINKEDSEVLLEKDIPVITSISSGAVEDDRTDIAIPELPIIEKDQELLSKEEETPATEVESVVELLSNADPSIEVEVILDPSDLRPPVPNIAEEIEVDVGEEITLVSESVDTVIPLPVEEEHVIHPATTYNMTKVLVENSYYLQLGAYSEQYSALDLAGSLGETYPVTVFITDSTDKLNYKVMVGPLGEDESGAIMYSFRSSGYPDAFLRKGF